MTKKQKEFLKMNAEMKLSLTWKILIWILFLGIIVSISLLFDSIQNTVIDRVEKLVLKRQLNNPSFFYLLLQMTALFGIFSCSLLIVVTLFFRQLLSVADSFLNKAQTARVCGISVKEILARQPFLLVFFLFILYIIKNTFLVIHIIGFDGLIIVLTFLIHISVSLFMYRKRGKSVIHVLACYFILVFSMLVNSFIFDHSYDGRAYHQVAAIQLNNGWNPFYANLPEAGVFIWNNHYPKFTEMFASILLSAFNNIELGKSYNMIFFIIVFLYALKYAGRFQKNKLVVTAIAVIFTANPVALAQFFTYYVDGVTGMLIIILLFACMEYERSQNVTDLLIIIAVSVFSINTKFTGFICGIVLIVYIIKQLSIKKYKIMAALICAGFAILITGVLFTGYNPYVTNTRGFGHPFYPLFGDETIDIISAQMTAERTFEGFNSMHPVQRFFSLFFLDFSIKNMPFNPVKLTGFAVRHGYDLHIGGFGVLFAEICILLFLVLFFAVKNKDITNYKKLFFPMIVLLFISVITPENWWARYIPYFWYLPGFLAMAGNYKNRFNKRIFLACFTMAIISSGSFLFFNTVYGIRYTTGFKSFLREMEASSQDTIHIVINHDYFRYSISEKFRYYNMQKNILFIEDENTKFSNGVPFSFIRGWY